MAYTSSDWKLKVTSGRNGKEFAEQVVSHLNSMLAKVNEELIKLTPLNYKSFVDTEGEAEFKDTQEVPKIKDVLNPEEIHDDLVNSIRGSDLFVINRLTKNPTLRLSVQDNFFEVLQIGEAAKSARAKRVTGVFPYMAYSRAHRREGRHSDNLLIAATCLKEAGRYDGILTTQLHSRDSELLFLSQGLPIDNLPITPLIYEFLLNQYGSNIKDFVCQATDVGGVGMVEEFGNKLGAEFSIALKKRSRKITDRVDNLVIIGDVRDKKVLVLDDEADTLGSLEKLVHALEEKGANECIAAFAHGKMNGPAYERSQKLKEESILKLIISTDSIEQKRGIDVYVTLTKLLASAIFRIHFYKSVTTLYHYFHNN